MQITATELAARLQAAQPPLLLDVRLPEEHAFVALPGSVLLPLNELPARIQDLEPHKAREIVVYCHHGIRSLHAIHFLREHGFEKLINLTGGIDAWSAEVDPNMPRY